MADALRQRFVQSWGDLDSLCRHLAAHSAAAEIRRFYRLCPDLRPDSLQHSFKALGRSNPALRLSSGLVPAGSASGGRLFSLRTHGGSLRCSLRSENRWEPPVAACSSPVGRHRLLPALSLCPLAHRHFGRYIVGSRRRLGWRKTGGGSPPEALPILKTPRALLGPGVRFSASVIGKKYRQGSFAAAAAPARQLAVLLKGTNALLLAFLIKKRRSAAGSGIAAVVIAAAVAAAIAVAATVAAATTAVAATAAAAPAIVAAAAPNDNQQDDDPAAVAAAKAVITHR